MVGPGVRGPEHTPNLAHDSSSVGKAIAEQRRGDQRRAVLRAEDHVGEKVRIGVRLVRSPPRGLGDSIPIRHPRLTPWATIFRP